MHKDQTRVMEDLNPLIQTRMMDDSPEAQRDCTLLVRAFLQGPDPLYLMEVAPEAFAHLCEGFSLSVEEGREAIETAHWQGPGALLDGIGLERATMPEDAPLSHRKEALWLYMASFADCTEGGYGEDVTMAERLQRASTAVAEFNHDVWSDLSFPHTYRGRAIDSMCEFIDTTDFTPDPLFGIPMCDVDHGFYVGYKLGHPAIAVQAQGLTFYGTVPTTSLEEQGITVDKQISPQFGIVFAKEE